jgi:teichuronic acid biosynthesis glycosyltransferase TuaG
MLKNSLGNKLKNMEDIKISIITPIFNAEKWIKTTINSVKAQSYKNWEHILVDDCSTDQSFEIISEIISNDDRFIYIRNKVNKGPAYSRNVAIHIASGKYLAFLDADDIWYQFKLSKQIKFMEENNFAISHHSYSLINEKSSVPMGLIRGVNLLNYPAFHKYRGIGYCLTFMINIEKTGKPIFPIEEVFSIAEDFLAFSPLIKLHHSILLDEPLGSYRIIKKSRSSNKVKAALIIWHIYYNREKLNFLKSLWYWLNYLANSFLLQIKIKIIFLFNFK